MGMPVFSGDSGRISLAFAPALEIIALPTPGHRVMPGVHSPKDSQRERMVVVKKLIALALVAAFLVTAGIGCGGATTKSGGGSSTGSSAHN